MSGREIIIKPYKKADAALKNDDEKDSMSADADVSGTAPHTAHVDIVNSWLVGWLVGSFVRLWFIEVLFVLWPPPPLPAVYERWLFLLFVLFVCVCMVSSMRIWHNGTAHQNYWPRVE